MEVVIKEFGGGMVPRREKLVIRRRYDWGTADITSLPLNEASDLCRGLIKLLAQGEVKKWQAQNT